MAKAQQMTEPKAKKVRKELTMHNHTRIDDYFWMNKRDSKDVLDYIQSENDLSKNYFDKNQSLIDGLLQEFNQRIDPNEIYPSYEVNGITFQETFTEGDDYVKTFILKDGKRQLFIDENERAKKKSYYELADWNPSPDNKLVAISEDYKGRRNYTISIRNFSSEQFLEDKIEGTDGSIEWANDNKTIFYVKFDPQTLRSYQVYRHVLGTKQKDDQLVYEDKDERFGVGIGKAMNDAYILIYSGSSTTTECLLIDANNPTNKPQVFLTRESGHEYKVEVHNNGFYILTNKNAKNRKVVFSKGIPNSIEECTEIISHNEDKLIEDITVIHSHLISTERNNGLEQIGLIDLQTKKVEYINLDEETYTIGLWNLDDYNTSSISYNYNSMTTPSSIFKIDLKTGQKELIYQKELLDKNFKSSDYESKRIWVTANDGTKVAISLVYKKGTDLKNAPCLLYGYGSYGYTLPDFFSPLRLSLLDRGFVYAQAHIRGEKYLGEQWYLDGKFLAKRNTFTDFINAAEYLGNHGYCHPEKLYINGGSAGGLLMGAVMNSAPYLFKGVIADVPFVDVVTTMLDESIPLTVGEYEEWGNPNEEEYYNYMLSYSPYDNVRKMDYPNLLITTGYHDSQVQYWEPLKWIAKLRDYRTNDNVLLLDCNMDAGHGGGSGRSSERFEVAKTFAFILSLENVK